jgi:hypothetical protein
LLTSFSPGSQSIFAEFKIEKRKLVRKWKVKTPNTGKEDEEEGVKDEKVGAREGSLDFLQKALREFLEGSTINRVVL